MRLSLGYSPSTTVDLRWIVFIAHWGITPTEALLLGCTQNGSCLSLSVSKFTLQVLVVLKEFPDSECLVGEVDGKLLALACQALHVLAELVAVKRELSELLVLIGERLIVILQLFHLVLGAGDRLDVLAKHCGEGLHFFTTHVVLQD